MSADILPFPKAYCDGGPTGPIMDDIKEQEEQLTQLLDDFSYGSQFDPKVSEDTLDEMPFALREANDIIERATEREARYSLDNGWPHPKERLP